MERRQASAPASGGRRKPPFSVARPARRLRAGSTTLRLPAFRFLFLRMTSSENRKSTFRDHACRKRVDKRRFEDETASAARSDLLRRLVVCRQQKIRTQKRAARTNFLSSPATRGGEPCQRIRPEVAGPMTSSAWWKGRPSHRAKRAVPLPRNGVPATLASWGAPRGAGMKSNARSEPGRAFKRFIGRVVGEGRDHGAGQ